MNIFIFLLVAVATYLLVISFLFSLGSFRRPRFRFTSPSLSAEKGILPRLLGKFRPLALINRSFARFAYVPYLQQQMELLDYKATVFEFLLLKEMLAVLGGVLVAIFFSVKFILIGVIVAFFLPDFILRFRVNVKKQEIARVLPETIDILNMCIGAGLDFLSSIRWLIEKAPTNAFVEQLTILATEIQVGKPRTEALKAMGKRLNLPEVNSFTRTLIQSDRMGTSMSEAFAILSEDIRTQRFQRGERYALKSSIKILFPLMFCILPVIFIVVAGPVIIKFTSGELLPGKGGAGF